MRHAGDQASGSGKMKRKLYEKDLHKFQRERQLTSSSTTFLTRLRCCFTIAHPRPHRVSENFHNRRPSSLSNVAAGEGNLININPVMPVHHGQPANRQHESQPHG